jgi:hypothetical protein
MASLLLVGMPRASDEQTDRSRRERAVSGRGFTRFGGSQWWGDTAARGVDAWWGFALAVPVARRVSASSLIDAITAGLPQPAPTNPFAPAFSVPWTVPPTLQAVRSDATSDYFEMVQRPAYSRSCPAGAP